MQTLAIVWSCFVRSKCLFGKFTKAGCGKLFFGGFGCSNFSRNSLSQWKNTFTIFIKHARFWRYLNSFNPSPQENKPSMIKPEIPHEEDLRLENLYAYDILDTVEDEHYNDLIELASQFCKCPTASITFIDDKRQWHKAMKNIDHREDPREFAICSHTILQDDVLVIEDIQKDERFVGNPLTTGNVGFYAGAPIISSAGYNLGTICVMDDKAKTDFSEKEAKFLAVLARQVSILLELNLKNKLIKVHADAHLKAEKRLKHLTIEESDIRESSIAYELHENLAQSLAATKLFLDSAETSNEMMPYFLKMSRENLSNNIAEIRKICKTITPTTFEKADFCGIIHDHVTQFSLENKIEIKFEKDCDAIQLSTLLGVNLFKIVQTYLVLCKKTGATVIEMYINTTENIHLLLKDDRKLDHLSVEVTDLIESMNSRIELVAGEYGAHFISSHNTVEITIPLNRTPEFTHELSPGF